jgi:hypothetical protein
VAEVGILVGILVDMGLVQVDQPTSVALSVVQQALKLLDEGLPPLRIGPAQEARPRSVLAFLQDSLRRCRAARIVSRQRERPKRSRTWATKRRRVQRGAGSAPATGGRAAVRCALRTTSPRSASIVAQRGTAAGAAESERVGTLGVVGGPPGHHGVCPPAGAHGHLRGAAVLGDVEQGERPFAGAGMGALRARWRKSSGV